MGLLFIMPATEQETDRVAIISDAGKKKIILKSYGLPLIFWGYLLAILALIAVMFLIIQSALFKLMNGSDLLNSLLAIVVFSCLLGLPMTLIAFFFYEKWIIKSATTITVIHKVFGLTCKKKHLQLKNHDSLMVAHHLASPNMAKLKNEQGTRGFQNQGYFQLLAELSNGTTVFIDRHARAAELKKIKELLINY